MNYIEIKNWNDLNSLDRYKKYKATLFWENGEIEKARIMKEEDALFIFGKGLKKYGRRVYNLNNINKIRIKIENEKERWEKTMQKIKKLLEESHLWPDWLENVKVALEIGLDKIKLADKLYWRWDDNLSYEENQQRNWEGIRKIHPRLNINIIWYLKNPKIKRMYFGKENNKRYLELIKKAMEEKKEISLYTTYNYDISFYYIPQEDKAWYNEEYKGKGNGHYYIALNHLYALYIEDD